MDKGNLGEIYNIGSEYEIEIVKLADVVKRAINSSSDIKFLPLPEHDPKRRAADITKLRKLGYMPRISLENGIKLMANSIIKSKVK